METAEIDQSMWVIEARGVEGLYLVSKLITTHFPGLKETSGDVSMAVQPDGTPIYFLRRAKLPVEAVAKMVGKGVDVVKDAKLIKVGPKEPRADLPSPTVPYWGEA